MNEIEIKIELALENIINKTVSIHSANVAYAPDIVLQMQEIHIIEAIGINGDINITELAHLLGFTKSTISRQVTALQNKNYIKKYKKEDNKKEIYIKLTELGERAYLAHIEFHEKRRYLCYEKMDTYSNREKNLILEFLTLYKESLSKYYDDYENYTKNEL